MDAISEQHSLAVFRRNRAQASIAAERAYLDVLSTQFSIRDELAKKNADSKMNVLDLLREIKKGEIDLRSFESNLTDANAAILAFEAQIAKAQEGFLGRKAEELAEAESTAIDLERDLVHAAEKTSHVTLFAPISGTVKALPRAVGQVVTPAEVLVNIQPVGGDTPEIVAYVPNREIGLVETDQEAVIKFNSLSPGSDGFISGRVIHVMAGDMLGADGSARPRHTPEAPGFDAPDQKDNLMSRVLVAPSAKSIMLKGREILLSAGMTVNVKIRTSKRRLIDYLLAPIMMLT
jgi:hemolysin D